MFWFWWRWIGGEGAAPPLGRERLAADQRRGRVGLVTATGRDAAGVPMRRRAGETGVGRGALDHRTARTATGEAGVSAEALPVGRSAEDEAAARTAEGTAAARGDTETALTRLADEAAQERRETD